MKRVVKIRDITEKEKTFIEYYRKLDTEKQEKIYNMIFSDRSESDKNSQQKINKEK